MRVGFIGAGFIARFQAEAIRQVRGLRIDGILDRTGAAELAAWCRERGLGEAALYGSIAEMAGHVDVLAIFAPNHARLQVMEEIAAAVKSGARLKGIVCEKPLGRNVREARRLVDAARGLGLPTAYYENQLFMKAVRAQKRQLAPLERRMGPLHLARSSEEHAGPHEGWFWDPVRQGGGVLSDMGCHSIAVGRYILTPADKPLGFLEPVSVTAHVGLLKWGLPVWREKLLREKGVDYGKTPAEDFATGLITYRNPQTGQLVSSQFTNSWMFEKQGLRVAVEGTGPGYAFEIDSLLSPLRLFVGDEAAQSIADREAAVEKSTASRGLIAVHYNEADLYGYPDENEDMVSAFSAGRDAFLPWEYGLEVTRLVMAAYLSAERGRTIDLTDAKVREELEGYVPAIQQGRGAEVLRS